ncbi:hypothetical protein [Nocardia sp. NPDC004860]|uniref:hypothetical protein n=1 Tax=Nocardia sp. NPDC004860 TaxID=3154557 RepID=UPI0033AB14BA
MAIGIGLALHASEGVANTVERASRRLLHAFNLPAGSDINRVLTQIASLERSVRKLNNALDDTLDLYRTATLEPVTRTETRDSDEPAVAIEQRNPAALR